jgi:hypothetical protein
MNKRNVVERIRELERQLGVPSTDPSDASNGELIEEIAKLKQKL